MSLIRAPAFSDLGDQRVVARPFEDDHRDVADLAARAPRAMLSRFSVGVARMSTWPAATGPTHSFSMYVSGAWVRPPASDAARTVIAPGLPVGDEVGALQRVHRDVDARDVVAVRAGPPDPLADVEHRSLVALALADDDPSGEVDLVHGPAHRLGRGGVGAVLVATTHEPRRFDGRGLGDPDHLEREELLHRIGRGHHRDAAHRLDAVHQMCGSACGR